MKRRKNMTETEKMEKGLLYDSGVEEILKVQSGCVGYMKEYNTLGLGDEQRMTELLKLSFAEVGEGTFIQPPYYANWGGAHVHLGSNVYANFNLTLVDDGHIYIGDKTMIDPNVTIQFNVDVHVGRNVWIGAGAVILPGITIGDNSVIGAGSIVTKDIPANVVAVGNPCRVLREIGERDREFYYKDRRI